MRGIVGRETIRLALELESRVAESPEKVFLFSESDDRRFTYREFDAAVNRAANMLAARGIGKGDVVSLLMPNGAEYVVAYFACFKLGALAGPVNSLLKPEEMLYVVADSEARLLLYDSQFAEQVAEVRFTDRVEVGLKSFPGWSVGQGKCLLAHVGAFSC